MQKYQNNRLVACKLKLWLLTLPTYFCN